VTSVSVVIPAYLSHDTIGDTLRSVVAELEGDAEVIVVDTSPDERTGAVVAACPGVRLLRPERRMWPHEARNHGVAAASGARLVFTDPDCRVRDGWLSALGKAFDAGAELVIGPTRTQPDGGWRARGVHRTKYSMWSSAARPPARVTAIPSSNLAIERAAWTRLGGYPDDRWHADTLLGWRANELGLRIAFAPAAVVEHVAEPSLRHFVREREERGRTFAAMRAASAGWSRPAAVARALACPLVPPLLLARCLRHAARGGELADAVATAPIAMLGFGAWSVGEARALMAIGRAAPRA
jgi:GT2 family glycosyltransferase